MLCQPKFVLTPASRISTCSVPILPCSWLFRGTFSFMRLLTSSSTNRWKAAEIQLHSSTLARVFTHLKCLVLRDTGYSQELCSPGQDAVDSFMCCPSLSLQSLLTPPPLSSHLSKSGAWFHVFVCPGGACFLSCNTEMSFSWAGSMAGSYRLSWHLSLPWADGHRE